MHRPVAFFHVERRIALVVHGDDFTAVGPKRQLDWFLAMLQGHYELTVGGRLGPGKDDDKEGRILNRIVRWSALGLEYEADPRQVERLLEETELEGEGVKGVVTPGVKVLAHEAQAEVPLPDSEVTRFRALAARANS